MLTVGIALPGCVTRKLVLRSDPPGARVLLDGEEIGVTPVEHEFLAYGTRRVDLELPGYGPLTTHVELERPWWESWPISIVPDLVLPWMIVDQHDFALTLGPPPPEHAAGTWDDARAAYLRMRARADEVSSRNGRL